MPLGLPLQADGPQGASEAGSEEAKGHKARSGASGPREDLDPVARVGGWRLAWVWVYDCNCICVCVYVYVWLFVCGYCCGWFFVCACVLICVR